MIHSGLSARNSILKFKIDYMSVAKHNKLIHQILLHYGYDVHDSTVAMNSNFIERTYINDLNHEILMYISKSTDKMYAFTQDYSNVRHSVALESDINGLKIVKTHRDFRQ